jgi:ribosome maturation factor RimP
MAEDREVEDKIGSVLEKAGLFLLEFGLSRHRGGLKVKAVIYSPQGTGTEECTKAYRLILPQIQTLLGVQDPDMEISSPGIDRMLRSEREWKAFAGKAVKLFLKGSTEWVAGRLLSYSEGKIEFQQGAERAVIDISSIAKARLDSMPKGE